jgi:hypothetical protein
MCHLLLQYFRESQDSGISGIPALIVIKSEELHGHHQNSFIPDKRYYRVFTGGASQEQTNAPELGRCAVMKGHLKAY